MKASGRTPRAWVRAVTVVAASCVTMFAAPAASASCARPANEIEAENCKEGVPATEWDVSGAGSSAIQGFATDVSVDQGSTVDFKVDTTASAFSLEIYRMGWYGGDGARLVGTVPASVTVPRDQPTCDEDQATGLIDCGNWSVSASWSVPADATSGIYFAKLVREDGTAGSSHVLFIVRDDDGQSDLLFQTSDTTWQAYNRYGGNSLYVGGPGPGRAYAVSYNRPLTIREYAAEDAVFNSEYPMVRWLERNGFDVSYFTGVDSDRRGAEIREHKAFLSVGHDEYWSGGQRANVQAARDAGVSLAFFSGNEAFWKTRWEDGHRTLVSYKETHAGAKIDPSREWTGTWRDARPFNPEGPKPENALTGTIFTVNSGTRSIQVPAEEGRLRLWRNTTAAALAAGATETLAPETLGYEWDEDLDNGARPAGLVRLSSTTATGVEKLQDYGSTYAPGTATHHLTLYRDPNGAGPDALVFGAGTVQWSWGLDSTHDRGSAPANRTMQQATANLFADMGVQAATLPQDLVPPDASTDVTPPSAAIAAPAAGGAVQQGSPVTISGTATDAGGRVGAVEISVDGGETWHPATGRASWTYSWTPSGEGHATLLARAADDSGNLGAAVQRTVIVIPRACPCSLFAEALPSDPAQNDGQAIEVGTRFRVQSAGSITALRYYRAAGWTGIPSGRLYSAGGQLLAQVTFPPTNTVGWQQAQLSQPTAVTPGTSYVVAYYSASGHYAFSQGFFQTDREAAPLVAPADSAQSPNGVFRYGGTGDFSSFNASNYWADVVFVPADTTAPTVQTVTPGSEATGVARDAVVAAVFSEPLDPASLTASTFGLRDTSGTVIPAALSYDAATRTARLTPTTALANGTRYTATVSAVRDLAGNVLTGTRTWSFTTVAPPTGGGPGGAPPGAGGAPATDVTAPRVTVGPKRVRASRSGRVALRIRCPRGEIRCTVRLQLKSGRRTVASARLAVAGGRTRTVRVRLTASARRTLARRAPLRVSAVARATDAAGNSATRQTTIAIQAPRRR
jgi:hypothetical protein